METIRAKLAEQVDEAEWGWLRAHLERGGLILVASGLELEEVGVRIATDDAALISDWIASGSLGKPRNEQIASWDQAPEQRFRTLIVSPYVLIQQITH